MATRRTFLKSSLGAGAAAGLVLGTPRGAWAQDSVQARNKAVVKRYLEEQGKAGFAAVREASQAPAYKQLRAEFQNLESNAAGSQLAALGQPLRTVFPDRTDTIEHLIADGDLVGAVTRIQGTHKGNLFGIPATGKSFDINEVAVFRVANQKIVEGWFMADEAGLLMQLGSRLPARSDGRMNVPPILDDTRDGNDVLNELLAHPADTPAYHNKVMVAAYKSANRPAGILPDRPGAPYDEYLRSGAKHLIDRSVELSRTATKFGDAFPDRRDRIGYALAEGDNVMMQFRLSATNTKSLFGMPPSNARVSSWEIGFMEFDGKRWKSAWFLGDDLGLLLQIGGPQSFLFGEAK